MKSTNHHSKKVLNKTFDRRSISQPHGIMQNLHLLALGLALSFAAPLAAEVEKTRLFHNGTILTVDEDFSEAKALAIRGNQILAVGALEDVSKAAGSGAERIDLEGSVMLPAFIDPHFHVLGTALNSLFEYVGLKQFTTVEEASSYMQEAAKKGGDWLLFRDLDLSTQAWDKESFTREHADKISDRKPVFVLHAGSHKATVNSKFLELLGKDPSHNGVLFGAEIFSEALPMIEPYANWDAQKGLKNAHPDWLAMGLATLGDTGTGTIRSGPTELEILFAAAESGAFPLRVRSYLSNMHEESWRKADIKPGHGGDQIMVIGFKLSSDGSNQIKTALQREAYLNSQGDKGKAYLTQQDLNRQVQEWSARGFQLAMHANGGGGIDNIIAAVREAESKGVDVNRPRIEHCSIVHTDQLVSFKELGLSGSFLMGHVRYWGGALIGVLGEERAKLLDRAGTFERMKIPYSLHSDSPVIETSPLEMIEIAVTRNLMSKPGYVLSPDERISVEAAIRAVTITPAWQMLSEDKLGSLEAGKLADLVVIAKDPRQIESDQISEIAVLETWIDGKKVFERK